MSKLIELAESALDNVFGENKKIPARTLPEDEKDFIEDLEICNYKFIIQGLRAIGELPPKEDIFSKCAGCSGLENTGCPYHSNHYINESDD